MVFAVVAACVVVFDGVRVFVGGVVVDAVVVTVIGVGVDFLGLAGRSIRGHSSG